MIYLGFRFNFCTSQSLAILTRVCRLLISTVGLKDINKNVDEDSGITLNIEYHQVNESSEVKKKKKNAHCGTNTFINKLTIL